MKRLILAALITCSGVASAGLDLTQLRDAARSRDLATLQQLAQSANGDVLEMYPRYYLLSAQINTLTEADVAPFLSRHEGSPIAERLRADWLKELGKRQDWVSYDLEYPKLESPSAELKCLAAQAAIARNDAAALAQAKPLWFSAKPLPDACNPVFDTLFTRNVLTSEDAWTRIRMTLTANRSDLARQLAARVGFPSELSAKALGRAANTPDKVFDASADSRAAREMQLYAAQRLARKDADRAAQLFQSASINWPLADKRYGWQQLGIIAAKSHNDNANGFFERGGSAGLEEAGRFWSVRAALRVRDFKSVLARIDAMPAEDLQLSVWRYWKAEALKALGRPAEAQPLLLGLVGGDDFYSLLAREELGPIASDPPQHRRADATELRAIERVPGIRRALALYAQNWRVEGAREWSWALKGMDDNQMLAASTLADASGLYDRSIDTAERIKQLSDPTLRYPYPWRKVVTQAAQEQGLDPAWVYGLIRQESRFVPDIRSSAGAAGLMQLMPATAKWVAGKMGRKGFDPSEVTDIPTNVSMGTFYLRYLLDRLDEHPVLVTAGYNAGPGRARNWQNDGALDAAIYIETIPFDETRNYVKKVLANAQHYGASFGSSTTLHQRLAAIPGKLVTPPQDNTLGGADGGDSN
ncbi:transglycosylase [Jeongeupia sp. HS-3]|uniref:lytic transglycosylase domain-containing protein n=1 Tax=Jeongeupia sp. HS-3 TaxID=1009682 RepID=UPI0018A4038C|nr:lytic transglycosylase domain-containing protein [Jeongeupia sp. HS-3]BCL77241.1 transglycosylase [Jeongeupia sp. HS-3]